jgi:hypothetical protein
MMKAMRADAAVGAAYNIRVVPRSGIDVQHVNVAGSKTTRRVLVVEDDPDIGRLVMLQLAELGCEGRLIDDGVTALAEAQATRYDLVILDVMLPRLDGLQIGHSGIRTALDAGRPTTRLPCRSRKRSHREPRRLPPLGSPHPYGAA